MFGEGGDGERVLRRDYSMEPSGLGGTLAHFDVLSDQGMGREAERAREICGVC